MNEILQTLISIIVNSIERVSFFYVVNEYEGGVIMRLGKFHKELKAGLIWKLPIIDDVLTCNIENKSMQTQPQSLTTLDNSDIVVESTVKYYVSKPKIFLIQVEGAEAAVADVVQTEIKKSVIRRTWDECRDVSLDAEVTKNCKTEARRWGIEVGSVNLISIAKIRSIRLIGSTLI